MQGFAKKVSIQKPPDKDPDGDQDEDDEDEEEVSWDEDDAYYEEDEEEEDDEAFADDDTVEPPQRATETTESLIKHEKECVRVKDLKDLKLPVLPDDAAGYRAYKNIVIPMVSSFDCGVGNTVWACISGAFGARGRAAEKLRFRPGDPPCPYPALNRAIAVQMITQKNLQHEELGAQFQEYVESCGKDGVPPSGFYMVSRIATHFDMDRVRQSAMTEVELFALEMSGNSLANLKEFSAEAQLRLGKPSRRRQTVRHPPWQVVV